MVKAKTFQNIWMTQDLQKSLKKGTFYEELFKTISSNNKNY